MFIVKQIIFIPPLFVEIKSWRFKNETIYNNDKVLFKKRAIKFTNPYETILTKKIENRISGRKATSLPSFTEF